MAVESHAAPARGAADGAAPGPGDRTRFARGALLGSLCALVAFVAMLAGPDGSLIRDNGLLGGFYDAQGRALLDGRLAVDPERAAIEGFEVGGRTYLYFGPVPALLRLPVLLVTDDLDERLTQLSMLLAAVVLLAAGAWLHWAVRRLLLPGAPVRRADVAGAFLLQLALGAGAIPLFLASWPVVYHEAELWGAAFAVAALAAIVGIVRRPTTGAIALAGVFASLAVNTRVSVGLGPILALGFLAAWHAALLVSGRGAPEGGRRTVLALVAAAAVPLALSAAINVAKFDRPFGIPLERQVASRVSAQRQAALAANPDGLFGAKFVPTTLVQAVRPDALGVVRGYPFVGLPGRPAHVFGDVRFDTIERSLSAPTSMPLFCLLTIFAVGALVRRRQHAALLGVLAASAGGFAVTLTIAYVTTRYLADLLPCVLLGAAAGLHLLLGARPRGGRRLALVLVGALGLAGLVVNGAVGIVSQRLVHPTPPLAERAAFVRAQDGVDRALGRSPRGVTTGAALPAPGGDGAVGDLFVLDACAALYARGLEGEWLPVERTPRSGRHVLDVRLPAAASGRPQPVLALGDGASHVTLTVRGTAAGPAFAVLVGGRTVTRGVPLAGLGGRVTRVIASFDPYLQRSYLGVQAAGRSAVTAEAPYDRRAPRTLGSGVRAVPETAPVCRRVTERLG
jgi:hypothetical protein